MECGGREPVDRPSDHQVGVVCKGQALMGGPMYPPEDPPSVVTTTAHKVTLTVALEVGGREAVAEGEEGEGQVEVGTGGMANDAVDPLPKSDPFYYS